MAQPSVHGRFIWQELMTADMAAGTAFYSKVIGWRVQAPPHGVSSSDYSIFATESGGVAGAMPITEEARKMGARPQWLPYVGADDLDGTVAKAERLGAKVHRPPADIPNVGRYAVLADPQGAPIGVFRPLQAAAAPPKGPPKRGEFAWRELACSDLEAAFKFYGELFGWEALRRMDMGPVGTYLVFGRDGVQFGGIYRMPPQVPAPSWLSYIEVANADSVVGPVRDAGGRLVSGPMDVPGGGRIAQLLDAGGVPFAVHTAPKEAAATATATTTASSAAKAPAKRPESVSRPPAPAQAGSPGSSAPTSSPAPKRPAPAAPAAASAAPAAPRAAPAPAARPSGAQAVKPVSKQAPAKKAVAKKTPAKKTAAKKAPVKKAPAKKAAAKKAAAKKATSASARAKKAGKAKRTAGRGRAKAKRVARRSSKTVRRRAPARRGASARAQGGRARSRSARRHR